ncbi:PREDICTED: protein IQ-DOMAIN 32-like [Tarenaya hassleriana]|uniref:protein IQ-DOMAIN 32-like n=1 Tax=Tarenaya hassleriana TaxID=28532 RepID=UPI00053C92AD|nr:PREDICTED: protein IQ-DOMAIN 32-like [Tarenaya hassleriana]
MGRSSACLRIIACGRNSGGENSNDNDLRISEVKTTKDKSGWSFRKKSTSPRVLSNIAITEEANYGHKENPDGSVTFSSQFTGSSNDSGKACLTQCSDDKVQLVVSAKSIASEHASNVRHGEEFDAKSDKNVQESAAVIVQATIRGFLARKKLLKLKDVTKLQPDVQCTSLENTVELDSIIDPQERKKSEKLYNFPGVSTNFSHEATESKLENGTLMPSESEENLITYEGEKINFHLHRVTDSVADDDDAGRASSEVHSLSNSQKANHFVEQQKLSDRLRNGRSKFTSGSDSRNASDTALIFGESDTDEPAPKVNSMPTTIVGSTHHSNGVSKMDDIISEVDSAKEEKIPRYAGSECGTELSISSTLDSPDRSEAGIKLDGLGKEIQDKGTEDISANLLTRLTEEHVENLDHAPDECSEGSVVSIDVSQIEQKLKVNTSEPGKELSFQEKPPSQEASSRTQELLQTPSTQVSTKSPRDRPDKRDPKKNQKSVSDKKSPLKPNPGQSPGDSASGKKRDSFGSDQEGRNSTSSNPLPRFMQATESARAKLQANSGSPKSSPDVQEGDFYVKKRHSLPIANVKEVSPRIQQSKKEKRWQR